MTLVSGEGGHDLAERCGDYVEEKHPTVDVAAGVVPVDGVAVEPWAIDAVLRGCHRLPADAAAWRDAGERGDVFAARTATSTASLPHVSRPRVLRRTRSTPL